MKRKLMILGGSFSYIGCIKAAREMGLTVLVADRNPEAIGFKFADIPEVVDISDPDGCLSVAQRHNIDGIVAVNDYGVMTASIVAEELGLPGLPIEVAQTATDKYLMRKAWQKRGAPTIRYELVSSAEQLVEAVSRIGLPAIIKPCDSRGGGCRGIMAIDQDTDLNQAFAWANSFYRDGKLLVEEMVSGLEHSVEAIVYQGQVHIVAISDKIKSPLPYRVDDTILYPTVERGQRLEELQEAVRFAVESIGMTDGIAHVELSMTDAGPVLFEIGARCGGGAPAPLVPYLNGVEEFKEAARIALGQAPRNLEPLHQRGCVIKFLYPRPGIVKEIDVPKEIESRRGVLSFGIFVKPGDRISPLKVCGDRAGMIITGAETVEQALELAETTLAEVRIVTKPTEETSQNE